MKEIQSVVIADNSPLFRQGVRSLLSGIGYTEAIAEADSLEGLSEVMTSNSERTKLLPATLIVVDRCLPGLDAFEQLAELSKEYRARILLMAEVTDAAFLESARHYGIDGVIDKSADFKLFAKVIRDLFAGHSWYWHQPEQAENPGKGKTLSSRQQRVFELLKAGLSNKQIAYELNLHETTIKYHISRIYRKKGLPANRVLLVANG